MSATTGTTTIATEPTAVPEPETSRIAPRMLLIGDSITEFGEVVIGENSPGWVARLRHRFGVRMHIQNYGRSGYNSNIGERLLLRALIIEPSPTIVLLFFGANDAAVPPSIQSLSIESYKRNLIAMVRLLSSHAAASITPILITPPPIDDNVRGEDRRFERTKLYAQACKDVAQSLNVLCVDLFSIMQQFGLQQCLSDGLHLSEIGNMVCEEAIVEMLEKNVSKCAPSKLNFSFTNWDLLHGDNIDLCIGPGISSSSSSSS